MPQRPDVRLTPTEALLARAQAQPAGTAFIEVDRVWDWRGVAVGSDGLAEAFLERGVGRGDRVAIHMANRVEVILAYLACWRVGAIAVPINTRFKSAEVATMAARVRPALYLGEIDIYQAVADALDGFVRPGDRFVIGHDPANPGARSWETVRFSSGTADVPRTRPERKVDGSEPALLLATSGTTGPSKLAVWTHGTLASFLPSSVPRGLGEGDRFVAVTPMMHASGAYVAAACLLTGASAVVVPRFDPDTVLDAIAAHRCTGIFLLPAMAAQLAHAQDARRRDTSSLQICIAGGDVCSADTEKAFSEAIGRPLLSMWAATEDTSCGLPAKHSGPITRMLPTTVVRLELLEGGDDKAGGAGEMLIRSPGTSPGYWLGPGRMEPLEGGMFHTGDLVRREPEGHLGYVGRLKDLIVRGGSNISPVEVEEVLLRQPGVKDAGVAGVPDAELGQRVGAAIVLADGVAETAVDGILAALSRDMADYKVPELTLVVGQIPRNAMTKVDRRRLGALFADSR